MLSLLSRRLQLYRLEMTLAHAVKLEWNNNTGKNFVIIGTSNYYSHQRTEYRKEREERVGRHGWRKAELSASKNGHVASYTIPETLWRISAVPIANWYIIHPSVSSTICSPDVVDWL